MTALHIFFSAVDHSVYSLQVMLICSHLEWASVTVWILGRRWGTGIKLPTFWSASFFLSHGRSVHLFPQLFKNTIFVKTFKDCRLRLFDDEILWSTENLLPLLKWEIIHPEWPFLSCCFFSSNSQLFVCLGETKGMKWFWVSI